MPFDTNEPVWPCTPSDICKDGQKIIRVETDITRLAGTPNIIWENDIKDDLRPMKINNWTKCIQVRVKFKEVVEKAKTFNQ